MLTRAAVVNDIDSLAIETVELDPPQAGEILVKMRAAGVCHSDLHTYHGELLSEPPVVLGHEGAGIVEAVGAGVTRLEPGDAILVNWLPACEGCANCLNGHYNLCTKLDETGFAGMMRDGTSRLKSLEGVPLKHYLGVATMSEHVVIDQENAIPIPDDVPFDVAAIIGCAVATGVGAVVNTARVPAGSSAAVIGCGGIGLSMIQGCRLAGCHPIIAIDVVDSKLEFARELGATDTINAQESDPVKALRQLVPNRPDYVFDSVGSATTIPQALRGARPGGTAVIVGLHAARQGVSISPAALVFENKRLLGSFVGAIHSRVDLPKLVELYRADRLQLDALITNRYQLDELAQAFEAMEAGSVARGVITFDD